ncbi:hypothetical protein KVP09_05720 [Alcaligenaceae bacterium CGII-47]|nr:hypothetical protein [Alcaligenaceae bacterium CGII-47]
MLKFTRLRKSAAIVVAICMMPVSVLAMDATGPASAATVVDRAPLPTIDADSLARDYATERAYRPSGSKQPIIGLTLSGGGTKDGQPTRISRIWLIKAAWDERAVAAAYTHPETCGSEIGQINCLLAVFYGHNTQ